MMVHFNCKCTSRLLPTNSYDWIESKLQFIYIIMHSRVSAVTAVICINYSRLFMATDLEVVRYMAIVYSGVRLRFYTYYIIPIEIGLLWAKINYLKSHSKALGFGLQLDIHKADLLNEALNKGMQRYQRSNLEVEKNICQRTRFEINAPGASRVGFYHWHLCSPLTKINA